jgi:protein TonB
MNIRFPVSGIACAALLASCSVPPPGAPPLPPATVAPQAALPPKAQPPAPPRIARTVDEYKQDFAQHVAQANPRVFADPLPPVLKSIVVLDVTIARDGRLQRVAVYRSNHYKELETAALDSVRRAAPYAAPPAQVRRGDGSLNFLETFLFRDDGQFRMHSLAYATK